MRIKTITVCLLFTLFGNLYAQTVAIKTNLLYDATTTLNLGAEFGLAHKWTLVSDTVCHISCELSFLSVSFEKLLEE